MAPPRPANSDERLCHLDQAQPEFVGSRGPGGEGQKSCQESCQFFANERDA